LRDILPSGPIRLVAICLVAFFLSAATLPDRTFGHLFDEHGLIESLTVALWLVAAAIFAKAAPVGGGGAVAWLAAPVCVAAALREADLHLTLTGFSILKIRFYSSDAFGAQEKLLALAVVLPIVLALAALLALLVQRLRRSGAGGPAMRLLLATLALLVLSKLADRSPTILLQWYGIDLSSFVARLMTAFEEGIELLLPVLFVASFRIAQTPSGPSSVDIDFHSHAGDALK
jgi:hypothetical protein